MRNINYHQESVSDLGPGDILSVGDNSYVLKKLSRGGMGYILMLEHNKESKKNYENYIGHKLALKTVLPGFFDEGGEVLFKRELTVWAALWHANIVSLIDIGICKKNNLFAIMPWHTGSLRDILNKHNLLSILDSSYIIKSILMGLAYAYDRDKVIHLDIKPENILYDKSQNTSLEPYASLFESTRFMLADWGISSIKNKILNSIAGDFTIIDEVTLNNIGTANYMAPERLRKDARSTVCSDIYSIGMVFFEMLTGILPVNKGRSFEDVISGDYIRVAEQTLKERNIPKNVAKTILSMIAYSSQDRPADYKLLCNKIINNYYKSESFASRLIKRKIL